MTVKLSGYVLRDVWIMLVMAVQVCPTLAADPLATVIEEASHATADQLRSAELVGSFTRFRMPLGAAGWSKAETATIAVWFERPRYGIDLVFDESSENTQRRVIVYDGTVIATSRFSSAISVTGCQVEVFPATKGDGPMAPKAAEFPWDPSRLASCVVDVPALFARFPDMRTKLSANESGDIVLRASLGAATVKCEWAKSFGYNARHFSVNVPGRTEPVQERMATWIEQDGNWTLASLSEVFAPADDAATKWELIVERFERNPTIPTEKFSLKALDMPGATRIIDRRPDVSERILFNPVDDSELAKRLDGIAVHLRTLPNKPPPRGAISKTVSKWTLPLIVGNVVGVALITIAMIARRRKSKGH